MARSRDIQRLYIGVGGHVVAIDASSGDEMWRTKLKGSMFVTVWHSGRRVFGGANGELFCLDAESGEIVWRNKLKGLGLGVLSLTSGGDQTANAAMETAAAAAEGAS